MHALLAVLGRRGSLQWYDLVFLAAFVAIVFPEKVLEWRSRLPRPRLPSLSVDSLQVGGVIAIGIWSLLLIAFDAKFHWMLGAFWLGMALAVRAVRTLILSVFGPND